MKSRSTSDRLSRRRGSHRPLADAKQRACTVTNSPIQTSDIHPNVYFICKRLSEDGHTTLLVGGAVRDLLLQRTPKDFDLATSARPEAVKRLFRNARIIGRRFRLVLLRYPSMSVEISTFRGEASEKTQGMIRRDNRYGTWEEDMLRRDFTMNAMFYDPLSATLYHPPGAMEDLSSGIIRTIKPPADSFTEDPVRMLRAVRFQVRLGFEIEREGRDAIRGLSASLSLVSRHRLADEIQRFLVGGHAYPVFLELHRLNLLRILLDVGNHRWFFHREAVRNPLDRLTSFLRRMDQWTANGHETIPPTVALLGLLWTLAEDGQRRSLNGAPSPGGDAKLAQPRQGQGGKLAQMLAQWGMLNGQVTPALTIVQTARALAGSQGEASPAPLQHLPGSREAWLLLAILQEELSLEEAFVAKGMERLGDMPDLPILDHPRPSGRARKKRGSKGFHAQRSHRSNRHGGARRQRRGAPTRT